jgi:hypothetical protein
MLCQELSKELLNQKQQSHELEELVIDDLAALPLMTQHNCRGLKG